MPSPKTEPRRADAERNVEAILDAATELLSDRHDVSMADVARQAGVVRATLYAHFPSRKELIEAVVERALAETTAAFDAARIDEGPAPEALERMVTASWGVLDRYRAVSDATVEAFGAEELHARHWPLMDRVRSLIERGRAEGAFRTDLPVDWLVATVFGLIHTARDEANAGRLAPAEAPATLQATIASALHSTP